MDKRIIDRINNMKQNKLPIGYRRTKDIGIAPSDWKLGKMSDVVTPVKRAVPKPDKPYWRLGVRSWAKGTFHTYVDEPEIINMDELYMVHENDLIVNITFAWEHAIAIAKKEDQGLLVSHRFPSYEFKTEQCPDYYKLVVSQRFFKDMLDHISPGGAGRNRVLNQKDFLNLPCYIPPYDEQKRIAEILLVQDRMIDLCEKKVEQLKKLKKVFLQKMFPKPGATVPEWRFPGFTDAWEQRKANELCSITTGKSNTQDQVDDGKYPFYIRSDMPVKSNRYLYDEEAVITIGDGNIGKVFHYVNGKFDLHQRCYKMADFRGVLAKYFYYFFSTHFYDRAMKMTAKATVDSVRLEMISDMEILFPKSYDEQRLIAEYLTSLDNLITLHQRKCDEEKQKKKALMQLLLTGIARVKI